MKYFEVLIKLRKILRSVNLESKRIEKDFGVSIPQLLVLQFLESSQEYRSTASKIKEYINLNASTVTGILQRLEQKGYLIKQASNQDKRSSHIVLTAKGAEFLQHAPTTQQELLTQKLQGLSNEQMEELERNIDLLIQIMDLKDMEAGAVLMPGEFPKSPQ